LTSAGQGGEGALKGQNSNTNQKRKGQNKSPAEEGKKLTLQRRQSYCTAKGKKKKYGQVNQMVTGGAGKEVDEKKKVRKTVLSKRIRKTKASVKN